MMDTVDGEYQNYKANDGAYVRKHFFGKHPKLLQRVATMSDDDIWRLNRGGMTPQNLFRLLGCFTAQGAAHGHFGEDHQRLWHGQGGRGPQHGAPDKET